MEFAIVIDTREQMPYSFGDEIPVLRRKLDTGDYSVTGLENYIVIERKSLDDFLSSITHGRRRFMEEMERMTYIPTRCVIVECSWEQIVLGEWERDINIDAVIGTIMTLENDLKIPVHFLGDREFAKIWIEKLLRRAAKQLRFHRDLVEETIDKNPTKMEATQ